MAEQEAGEYTGVTLFDCTMEDGMARVIYQYTDGDALVQFTSGTQDEANQVNSITAMTGMEGLAVRTAQDQCLEGCQERPGDRQGEDYEAE